MPKSRRKTPDEISQRDKTQTACCLSTCAFGAGVTILLFATHHPYNYSCIATSAANAMPLPLTTCRFDVKFVPQSTCWELLYPWNELRSVAPHEPLTPSHPMVTVAASPMSVHCSWRTSRGMSRPNPDATTPNELTETGTRSKLP